MVFKLKTRGFRRGGLGSGATRGHGQGSQAQDVFPPMPGGEHLGLIRADQKHQIGRRVVLVQTTQGVDHEAHAWPTQFTIIHSPEKSRRVRQLGVLKRQAEHSQSVLARRQGQASVSGLPGGNQTDIVQPQLREGRLSQGHMGLVRRIESTAKNPDTGFSF
jgi:hypothetical protein